MTDYGEVDYDPQASLEAHEAIEAQREPTEGDGLMRILVALGVVFLLSVVLIILVLYWAVQVGL